MLTKPTITTTQSDQYYGPRRIAENLRAKYAGYDWRDPDVPAVYIDLSCYYYHALLPYIFQHRGYVNQYPHVLSELVPALASHPDLARKRVVIASQMHPEVHVCIRGASNFALIRGDFTTGCTDRTLDFPLMQNPALPRSNLPLTERKYTLSFIGHCEYLANRGKTVRALIAAALSFVPDTYIYCSNSITPPMDWHESMEVYRRSVFCLVPAGDTHSSIRLSEIPWLGCIPVRSIIFMFNLIHIRLAHVFKVSSPLSPSLTGLHLSSSVLPPSQ